MSKKPSAIPIFFTTEDEILYLDQTTAFACIITFGPQPRYMLPSLAMRRFNPDSALDLILNNLFDYAGMFPPAARSFSDALKEAADHPLTLERPWMIGSDLVLDTANSTLLASTDLSEYKLPKTIHVSVLASEGLDKAFNAALSLLDSKSSVKMKIAAIETKISTESLSQDLAKLGVFIDEHKTLAAVEPDLSKSDWRDLLKIVVSNISASPHRSQIALKCRSTGPTGIGPDKLAAAIVAASDAQIPFKVTGGFHHPIVEPQAHQYPMGFLNLASAVLIRRSLGAAFPAEEISRLLLNDSIKSLSFDQGLTYNQIRITLEELRKAKNMQPFSIGSCSIHEPDRDLLRLIP
jgi:hypothetical protein